MFMATLQQAHYKFCHDDDDDDDMLVWQLFRFIITLTQRNGASQITR